MLKNIDIRKRFGRREDAYTRNLLQRPGGERRGEQAESESNCERIAYDHHAAAAVRWLSTVAIFRPPSILRNMICWLAIRPKSRTSAASCFASMNHSVGLTRI